jgi:hypothetical protein
MDFLVRKCCCPPKPACLEVSDCKKHNFWRCCGFDPVVIPDGIPRCGYSTGTAYCASPPSEEAEYAFISYVIEVAPPPSGGEFYRWGEMVFPGGSGIPTMVTGKVGLPMCPPYIDPGGSYCNAEYMGVGKAGTGIYENMLGESSWEGYWDCEEAWRTWQAVNQMSNLSSDAGNGGTWGECCLPAYDNYTLEQTASGDDYEWVYSSTTPEQCGSPSVWSPMDGRCQRCLYCNDGGNGCAEWEYECGGGAHCPLFDFTYGPEPIQYPCGASCIADITMNWVVVGELSTIYWSNNCSPGQGYCDLQCCINVEHKITWQNMATGRLNSRTISASSRLHPSTREGSCKLKLQKTEWHESIGNYFAGTSNSHQAIPSVTGPLNCRPDASFGGDWEAGEVCSRNALVVHKPLRYCDPCDPYSWCRDTGLGTGASGHVDDCYGMGAGEQGDWCGCYYPTVSPFCQPAEILNFEIFST